MLTTTDLEMYCQQQGLPVVVLRLKESTPTVQAAAQAADCPPEQIVKSVLFLVAEEPVLVVTSGLERVDRRRLADFFGVSSKRVRLAFPAEVENLTGYAVGALPPFGHTQRLTTCLDKRVLEQTIVYAGGGSETALIQTSPEVIQQESQAVVLNLVETAQHSKGDHIQDG
jgi:prolyl-tRNA editing enzyme YbaK/EbsC (Cys-tRNA(Pro) deacylase)